jgi:hypothetical protein
VAADVLGVADGDAEIIDDDLGATGGEQQGVLPAEVAPGAGDDDDLVGEA